METCIQLQGQLRDVNPSCCIRVQIGFGVTFATECQMNTMCDFEQRNLITWCFIIFVGGNIYDHEGGCL